MSGDTSVIAALSAAQAQRLVRTHSGRLNLDGLTSLSPEVAAALARYHDDISLGDRLFGLLGHFMQDAILGNWLEPSSVNDEEGALAYPALTIMAVAGKSGEIGHQRITRAREAVEQGRFADIGSSHYGN